MAAVRQELAKLQRLLAHSCFHSRTSYQGCLVLLSILCGIVSGRVEEAISLLQQSVRGYTREPSRQAPRASGGRIQLR